jgi:hypothetical protein
MARTASQQQLVDTKLDEVLTRASLPVDSPVRGMLDRDVEVFDTGREFAVHVPGPDRDISLSERLEEIKHDPMFAHNFPGATPKIARNDANRLREHFDDIASGKVVVGD